ncbi:fucolectin-4-like [Rhopilema esculentum]|uniref:fucolectin-4-like n=1 Tax=Rhopilema esculentum TaxID=499914 RepID=UPI0031DFD3C1
MEIDYYINGRCEAHDKEQLCGAEQVCQEDYHSPAGYKCKNLENIALGKDASQSTSRLDGIASNAVDGIDTTNYNAGSCTHTLDIAPDWWRVDFGKNAVVHSVKITNRGECCEDRLSDFNIVVGNSIEGNGGSNTVCVVSQSVPEGGTKLFLCRPRLNGRYLYIQQNRAEALTLCEVRVFGEFLE